MKETEKVDKKDLYIYKPIWAITDSDDVNYGQKKGDIFRNAWYQKKITSEIVVDILDFLGLAYYNNDLLTKEQVKKIVKIKEEK